MISAKKHEHENERLKDLASYAILDTLPEKDYDDLTTIAAQICGTSISLISLIDQKRQWFKSHHGLKATETPREYAFCAHAIVDPNSIFIIEDARKDNRFHDNPLVTGNPHVIFYAGVPLMSDNGLPLGTLCVIDDEPKLLSQSQIDSLKALANQVMSVLNLRKTKLRLEQSLIVLENKNLELERFASVAAHDLKSPLIGISGLASLVFENYAPVLDDEGQNMLSLIVKSSDKLRSLIDGLLAYSRSDKVLKEQKSTLVLEDFKNELFDLFQYEEGLNINYKTLLREIITNRTALEQIMINLISNAIKYNDKEKVAIEIGISETPTHYRFFVKDNGPGIDKVHQQKIFEIFEIISAKDKFGVTGNGIGLATVKKIVENSGGSIHVESALNEGTKFAFTIEK